MRGALHPGYRLLKTGVGVGELALVGQHRRLASQGVGDAHRRALAAPTQALGGNRGIQQPQCSRVVAAGGTRLAQGGTDLQHQRLIVEPLRDAQGTLAVADGRGRVAHGVGDVAEPVLGARQGRQIAAGACARHRLVHGGQLVARGVEHADQPQALGNRIPARIHGGAGGQLVERLQRGAVVHLGAVQRRAGQGLVAG